MTIWKIHPLHTSHTYTFISTQFLSLCSGNSAVTVQHRHIRGLFNHFEKKRMVSRVKTEALKEIDLVDKTPVREFRRRNACRNCLQMGHRAEDCQNERVETTANIKCHNCDNWGHRQGDCPDKPAFCRNCRETGHRKQQYPEIECRRCRKKGHSVSVCPELEDRTCSKWGGKGHVKKDCPVKGRKLRIGHAHNRSGTAAKAKKAGVEITEEPIAMTTEAAGYLKVSILRRKSPTWWLLSSYWRMSTMKKRMKK